MKKLTPLQLKWISICAGVLLAALVYLINPFQVKPEANTILAVATLMITWWIAEALPMPVVALLPLVLFPLLKINTIKATASSYGNENIFLFMGGFMLGLAIEKWNLHRRIALSIVKVTGTSGDRIILGFILATGLLSMWLSNTATTMMMFPIALSVIHVMKENNDGNGNLQHFALCMMLAIAYAANFGGIATIIGTPPNVQFAGYYSQRYGNPVGFVDWMLLCAPVALLLLLSLYFVSTKILFPNRLKKSEAAQAFIRAELKQLGPLSPAEVRVLIIFISTALLWILRLPINKSQSLFQLDDTMIAMLGGLALFLCPAGERKPDAAGDKDGSILEWEDTRNLAWGILLLFGGGIALADALEKAGLIQQLGQWLGQYAGHGIVLVILVTVISVFISEVMSNIAQVIVFGPVVCSIAEAAGMHPLLLGLPMTLAASCASMLPMGTPPNAIVFASGHIKLKQMLKAGFVMNLVSILLIVLFCWFLLPLIMGIR